MNIRHLLRGFAAPLLALAGVALSVPAASAAAPHTTIFVAGDSTASIYAANEAPRTGWGQALPAFVNQDVDVVDEAISGASTKSFIALGGLDRIDRAIGPGDFLLISFGHNDEKTYDPTRGTLPWSTYQDYLEKYVDVARSHGATPVLVTPVERRNFDATGQEHATHGDYPAAMAALGQRLDVPVIDLTSASRDLWQRLGPDLTTNYFLWVAPGENPNYPNGVSDNTHFQTRGAIEVARIVASHLKDQDIVDPRFIVKLGAPIDEDSIVRPDHRPT